MTPVAYHQTAVMLGEGLDVLDDATLLLRYRQGLRLKCGRQTAEQSELVITRAGFRVAVPRSRPARCSRRGIIRRIIAIARSEQQLYPTAKGW